MIGNMRLLPGLFAALIVSIFAVWTPTVYAQAGQWESAAPGVPEVPPDPGSEEPVDYSLQERDAEEQSRALEQFEPELSPYGSWRDDSQYGRVWVPRSSVVGSRFVPYQTGGHWTLTVHDDWLWVSDYPFGWVAFHYGRWVRVPGGVWGWVPGYRYSPAWVDFRVGVDGYVGWGPRAPRRYWRGNTYGSFGAPVVNPFIFCPSSYVFAAILGPHILRDHLRIRRYSQQSRRYRTRRSVRGRRVYGPTLRVAGVARAAAPGRRVSLDSRRRRTVRRSSTVRKPGRRKATRRAATRRDTSRRATPQRAKAARRRQATRSRSRATTTRLAVPARRSAKRNAPRAKPRKGTAAKASRRRSSARKRETKNPRKAKRRDKKADAPRAKAKRAARTKPRTESRAKSRAKPRASSRTTRTRSRSSRSKSKRSGGSSRRAQRRNRK